MTTTIQETEADLGVELEPSPAPSVRRELAGAAKAAAVGLIGGVVTLAGLAPALMVPHCGCGHGASADLAAQRAVRQRCLELGVTPAELAALEARGELPTATPTAAPTQEDR